MLAALSSPLACDLLHGAEPTTKASSTAVQAPPQAAPAVELTEAQQSAIRIEPVGTYSFFNEREAVGNVSFDEDPAIVQAESTLIGAAATFELARKEFTRVQALGEANGIAQKELEQATADQQSAAAALQAARDAVRALGKTDAQIDRLIATGGFEEATSRGATKWVVANINESDAALVRVGQAVTVKVTPYPDRRYLGKIARIYATVDPDTHRMTARAQVSDPRDELRPGMLANVAIRVSGPVESVAVPMSAVVREGDGTMIAWVTSDRHHFAQRLLNLGLQRDGRYQVLGGLRQGELLVVAGGVFLSNMLEAPPSD